MGRMRTVAAVVALALAATLLVTGAPVPAGATTTVIDFDDVTAPWTFDFAMPLRDAYAAQGVTFSGPGPADGGAVLNEASNFGVSGYSGPNFLAFNTSNPGILQNGGTPAGPETMTFAQPVKLVSMYVASPAPGTVTVEAYDSGGDLVDSASTPASTSGTTLTVTGLGIVEVVLSFDMGGMVMDDLTFVTDHPPVADAGADQTVTLGDAGVEVTLDGSGSSDQDGDPLTFTWTGPFEESIATGEAPVVTFTAAGTYEVTLEVAAHGATATDTVTITVLAAPAPTPTPAAPAPGAPSSPSVGAGGAVPVPATPRYAG